MKKAPRAYALVDKATKLIRMEPASRALAIFETREAARTAARVHEGCSVVPISLSRQNVTHTVVLSSEDQTTPRYLLREDGERK